MNTLHSKMAAIIVFFDFLQITPCCLVYELEIQKILRADLEENKRTLNWRPFWNKIYLSQHALSLFPLSREAKERESGIEFI